ncbi:MAG: ABC transporter ATP-binding protein [Planctomycetes bacterium]|nr:ABC transporter ATP-binding protein [Planctomycetota bacterium]
MSAPDPVVTLTGVVVELGGQRVLDRVDVEARRGRVLVLLGRSGAGKTTLLRVVAGLEAPDEGTVHVDGHLVAGGGARVPPERRGVGMVFQTLELWPHMTAAENVAFGLAGRPRGARAGEHPRVLEVAAAVGFPASLLRRRPPSLSGGERQRVAIARALAPAPAVLLYDEPLAHLDPSLRDDVRALVRRVTAATGTSAVYVTHDPEEATEVGDDLVVLERGRVVERGTPAEVFRAPRTWAGARALGAAAGVRGRRREAGVVETPLGALAVVADPALDAGRVVLRPAQVAPAADGPRYDVVDAHPVVGGHAFTVRLPDGVLVEGRSSSPVAVGATTAVRVEGLCAFVPEEGPSR